MFNSELVQLDLMLQDCYTADLCWEKMRPKWNKSNASWGMCAIVALLVNELFDGEIRKTKVGEYSHFFNFIDGNVVDLTGRQFNTKIDYENSVACKRDEILNENTSKRYIKLKERLASGQTQ